MQVALTTSHLCPSPHPPHLASLSRAVLPLSLRTSVEPLWGRENLLCKHLRGLMKTSFKPLDCRSGALGSEP